ncbi:hypothetical protein BH11GEM2_BH11GEM2_33210 [soil metagenome]
MGGVHHADFFAARTQMAASLGFHIIFATSEPSLGEVCLLNIAG